MSIKLKDNSHVRIDPPCEFINPNTVMPMPESVDVLGAVALLNQEEELTLVRVFLGPDHGSVFYVENEEQGDAWGIFKQDDRWMTTKSIFDHDRKIEALKLFVDSCGAGMMHHASWEEHEEYGTQLTHEEFDKLYAEDVSTLARIMTERE